MSNNNNQSANVIIPKFKKFPPSTDGSDSIKNNIQIYPIPSTPFDDTLDHHVLADKSEDEFRNITTSNKIQEPLNTADAIALAERYELSVNVNTNKKRYPRKSAIIAQQVKESFMGSMNNNDSDSENNDKDNAVDRENTQYLKTQTTIGERLYLLEKEATTYYDRKFRIQQERRDAKSKAYRMQVDSRVKNLFKDIETTGMTEYQKTQHNHLKHIFTASTVLDEANEIARITLENAKTTRLITNHIKNDPGSASFFNIDEELCENIHDI